MKGPGEPSRWFKRLAYFYPIGKKGADSIFMCPSDKYAADWYSRKGYINDSDGRGLSYVGNGRVYRFGNPGGAWPDTSSAPQYKMRMFNDPATTLYATEQWGAWVGNTDRAVINPGHKRTTILTCGVNLKMDNALWEPLGVFDFDRHRSSFTVGTLDGAVVKWTGDRMVDSLAWHEKWSDPGGAYTASNPDWPYWHRH